MSPAVSCKSSRAFCPQCVKRPSLRPTYLPHVCQGMALRWLHRLVNTNRRSLARVESYRCALRTKFHVSSFIDCVEALSRYDSIKFKNSTYKSVCKIQLNIVSLHSLVVTRLVVCHADGCDMPLALLVSLFPIIPSQSP